MVDSGRPCPACATPVPTDVLSCPSCGAISLPSAGGDAQAGIALRLSQALGQRYRVERELGRGGMAVVFLAHDLRHDRPVAIKVLLPELSRYLGLERFLREIHIAAQLNHPHILPLHDSGEADGLLFYVMPYVEGDSLRRRLAREGPLPVAEAVRIAAEVADGLAYAHHLGVVHRDIKPENILLTQSHAVIADFGIARAVAGAGPGATITTVGISLGTPNYMSPEQAAADPALDHRTDIYALGCTLYEMLTGRPPYPGPTPQALAAQHLTEPVPAPRARRREVPVALGAAVRRAMAKAAADRFQTAADFGAALGGLPVTTGPGASYPGPAGARRWRAAAAVAAVVVVAGGAALLVGRGRVPVQPAARAPLRVVVRPFEDRTGGLRSTADRITEALTDRLQPVPALAVTASAVVAELRNAPLDTLRARFAPDRIVLGRVEAAGPDLRVAAQIVDARTGRSLADSELTVPRGAGSAAAVAGPLSVFVRHAFWADLEREARRARVRDSTAWTFVERARELADAAERAVLERLDRMGFRSMDVADSLLREAHKREGASDLIPIESARIADLRAFFAEYLLQVLRIPPAVLPAPAAERARALALLDRLIRDRGGPADAFELRGRIKEGLWRSSGTDSLLNGAVADYRSATELDLHRATAWMELGSVLRTTNQYTEALLALEHAFEEDVFQLYRPILLRYRFDAALGAQRYDVAAEACRTGMAEGPDDVRFSDCELLLLSRAGADRRQAALAQARADRLARSDPGTLNTALRELWLAEILERAGLADSADRVAQRALAGAPTTWLPLLLPEAAYLRVLRGERDSAVALVVAAVRQDPSIRRSVRSAPWFLPLHSDPRFIAAVGASPTRP
jgi:serine/threonine-protein kinase